jgi:sulfotransferase
MQNFYTIGGLPRTGSTLICNILNQNPDFYAGSTSPIPLVIQNMSNSFSEQPEIVNYLESEEECYTKMAHCARGVIDEWYSHIKKETIFDKSRVWNHMGLIYKDLYPQGKMIITVRDPRNIVASMEKQHRKNPLLGGSHIIPDKSFLGRLENSFAPDGLIGGPMLGIIDLISRKLDFVHYVRHEDLVVEPEYTMRGIYRFLNMEYFNHDFKNIESQSNEIDSLYQNKYPHKTRPEIKPPNTDWRQYMTDNIASDILNRFPIYKEKFNYQ